ncbi:aconitate hydratase [Proteiniclasticum sp. BAD-10]|uniref:Aconitate hydratase n=1 Tax=Proteiniclasticum sediminis TaxID=2804028 RepID=A0A941CNM6_9CLOT|nr:aconitate hydratase [Proteiniclasticum sediminis]MBR0576035.1 aconitate hydratase [Proteiniclasticum sediminis]
MGLTLTEKILQHAVKNENLTRGSRIGLYADQTLSHDLNVIMTYLALENMGLEKKKVPEAFQYVDHNMIQADFKNADDHRYIQGMAEKLGITLAKSGSGICHFMHLEHYAKPGKVLIGGDSHVPACGGVGSFGLGVGGFDNALAIAGEPVYISMPKIVRVTLTGELQPFVSAKNVVLELLRRVGVKGGVGKVFEYSGEGVLTLNVSERATITNMGTETGATSSLFPSDEETLKWLKAFGREEDYVPLSADVDARYDEDIYIDLTVLEPLIALPSLPDKVVRVREVEGTPIDQVMIGSCTNTSAQDLLQVAKILEGMDVASSVELGIYPSSRTVIRELLKSPAYRSLVTAGARIFEPSCGGCNGCGFAPATGAISLRTTPRNFPGRSGTKNDQVYLTAPETAAASALRGVITDPRDLGKKPAVYTLPERFDDHQKDYLHFPGNPQAQIIKGSNITPIPEFGTLPDTVSLPVVLKTGDDITTDIICPAGALYLPIRSNIPEISKVSFHLVDPTFHDRAKALQGSILVTGANYGQGSSREQAAIIPRYLGIQAILAKSFARLHLANLVNWGVLPLIFQKDQDYEAILPQDVLQIENTGELQEGQLVLVRNLTQGTAFFVNLPLFQEDIDALKHGGTVNAVKYKLQAEGARA